jgi:hypothetical protein
VGIIHLIGQKLARLARKYRPLVPALRELILRPDTPLEADVKDMIAARRRPGAVHLDRAWSPSRRQRGQPATRCPARST